MIRESTQEARAAQNIFLIAKVIRQNCTTMSKLCNKGQPRPAKSTLDRNGGRPVQWTTFRIVTPTSQLLNEAQLMLTPPPPAENSDFI